ncbi:hypothetical protein BDZ89DRAFT_536501 [Hymenopellis radicata]|nr:hypothetical protein BDZ89DRAFT_536501 [Hymenopellis radicata]
MSLSKAHSFLPFNHHHLLRSITSDIHHSHEQEYHVRSMENLTRCIVLTAHRMHATATLRTMAGSPAKNIGAPLSETTSHPMSATNRLGQDAKTASIMLIGIADIDRALESIAVRHVGSYPTTPPPPPRRQCIPLPSQISSQEEAMILHPLLQHPPIPIDLAMPWTEVLRMAAASPLLWAWNNVATNPPLPSMPIIVVTLMTRPIVVFPSLGRAYITVGDIVQRVWEELHATQGVHVARRLMGMSKESCDEDCWRLEFA